MHKIYFYYFLFLRNKIVEAVAKFSIGTRSNFIDDNDISLSTLKLISF